MKHQPCTHTGISVLLVEDSELWSERITSSLADFGYETTGVAATFEEAILLLNAFSYDVVLININVEKCNKGLELGRMVKALYHKPFIYLTSDNGRGTIEEAVKTGPSAYLIKPADPASLHAAIQAALTNANTFSTAAATAADENIFFVKSGNRYKRLDWSDIVYLHSDKNYTVIFNALDKQEYFIRSTLAKTLSIVIPPTLRHLFVQVNRAEAVHINHIQEITGEEVRTSVRTMPLTDLYSTHLRRSLRILS